VWGKNAVLAASMKGSFAKKPLGIVCDFNGSARTVSIDKEFFCALGFKFECINDKPGQIAHRIVPEGESLEPCARLLEETHSRDPSFMLGYVPDCDGDRGNLVIWDDKIGKARTLEAQEVFALACVAEFSHIVWTGELLYDDNGKLLTKAAVAINDPTSMRIDRIAQSFGISIFRAEVGEANVVTLARKLREEGYLVRILGEGSAGGNITHPSSVRDPINTVLAIAKMLSVRSVDGKPGLFEIWHKRAGLTQKYCNDFTLADIITSLPPFVTTPAYNKDAVMRINTPDHALLKDRYQEVFLREWEERKNELKMQYGFYSWEAIAYNGTAERRNLKHFGEAGRGGLKILFLNSEGRGIAYIWMRGSATEPVFRIMADAEGADTNIERFLLDWQNCMIMKADS
jgi:phosphoglucomutase